MSGLICPKCGRTSDEVDFIEAFCIDCYPVNIQCPQKVVIEQCKACKKIKVSGEWIPHSRKRIAEHVISKCKGEFSEATYDLNTHEASLTVVKDNSSTVFRRRIKLVMKTVMCRHCSRISGGYFQGIIQLRGDEKRVKRYARMLTEKLGKTTFITKEEEKHGGIDLYVGSSKAVVQLLSEMGVKALITRKLVGREKGRRLYRTTFRIRF